MWLAGLGLYVTVHEDEETNNERSAVYIHTATTARVDEEERRREQRILFSRRTSARKPSVVTPLLPLLLRDREARESIVSVGPSKRIFLFCGACSIWEWTEARRFSFVLLSAPQLGREGWIEMRKGRKRERFVAVFAGECGRVCSW